MNLIGKIFIVLILVMSLMFMGFTVVVYRTHTNWYEVVKLSPADASQAGKAPGLEYQLAKARQDASDLSLQLESIKQQTERLKAERDSTVARLETERSQLQGQYEELQNDEARLKQQLSEAVAEVQVGRQTLSDKLNEIAQLRGEIEVAQTERDEHFKMMVAASDELYQVQNELVRLNEKHLQLTENFARASMVLDRHDLDAHEPVDGMPPKIDGVILASRESGLVEISLGSDDGLRRGNTLEVYRLSGATSKYLGRVEVVELSVDKSVAKVVPGYLKAAIRKEDRVATRLN